MLISSALKQKLDEGLVLTRREYSDLIDLGKPLYGSPLAARYEQLNNVQQMKSALGLDSQESKDKKPRLLDPLFGVDDTTIQTYNGSVS